ncbi:unnamed protein product [Hymenolepis diminuta]|uniref:Ig-like domain-containing protein n=1 Tax=Hymenolepis diminuta TaxID=6216 RepID=A0A564Y784_HYMDI|nr:unnamed protein product [Hymenolepis diminuta]
MFSYIITPNLRFSLLCLSLSVAATIIKTSNSTDFHLQPYQLHQSDLNKSNFNHDTSSTASKRHFFFADVNTKIHAKVGEKVELPCLVYGIDIKDVVISWWKAGEYQELSLGLETRQHRYYLRRSFYEDWTLVIDNVQEVDAGFYACQINADTLLEKIFLLNVTVDVKPLEFKSAYQEFLKDEGFYTNADRLTSLSPSSFTSSAAFQNSSLIMSFIPVVFSLFQAAFTSAFLIDPT